MATRGAPRASLTWLSPSGAAVRARPRSRHGPSPRPRGLHAHRRPGPVPWTAPARSDLPAQTAPALTGPARPGLALPGPNPPPRAGPSCRSGPALTAQSRRSARPPADPIHRAPTGPNAGWGRAPADPISRAGAGSVRVVRAARVCRRRHPPGAYQPISAARATLSAASPSHSTAGGRRYGAGGQGRLTAAACRVFSQIDRSPGYDGWPLAGTSATERHLLRSVRIVLRTQPIYAQARHLRG